MKSGDHVTLAQEAKQSIGADPKVEQAVDAVMQPASAGCLGRGGSGIGDFQLWNSSGQ